MRGGGVRVERVAAVKHRQLSQRDRQTDWIVDEHRSAFIGFVFAHSRNRELYQRGRDRGQNQQRHIVQKAAIVSTSVIAQSKEHVPPQQRAEDHHRASQGGGYRTHQDVAIFDV